MLSTAGTSWLAEADAEDAISVDVQPRAPSGPVLGKGAATGDATATTLSAGVQPWAMETKSPSAGVQPWAIEKTKSPKTGA